MSDRAPTTKLVGSFVRVGVMNELQYRINFVLHLIESLLELGVGLLVLAVVFDYTDTLRGWTGSELLVIMGIFTLVRGLVLTFVQPNMQRLMAEIREGKLDYALTKPADAQTLISVRDVRFWNMTDTLVGLVVLVIGLARTSSEWSATDLAAFIAVLLLGLACLYCFWLMLATAAFWLIRMGEVEELFSGLYRAGQYPTGIYPGWLRIGLTFIVPLAFAVSVPAEALTNRLTIGSAVVALAATAVLVVLSRWFWHRGLRRYDGASA
jgi:ABC-2 type transport system permease protein